jgi:hypothetical protein
MQMHSDPGLETHGRLWENEPRGGWDAFLAAKRRHLMRLAHESNRSDDVGTTFPVEWSSLSGLDGEG